MERRIAFAANREIGLRALEILIRHRLRPVLLMLPAERLDDGGAEMRARLDDVPVLRAGELKTEPGIERLRAARPDYLLSVHYPHILSADVLAVPRVGALNLHPAYLPYNRGWHTASWAILEDTPFGATLHWMDESLDTGDIALQEEVRKTPADTADTLYRKALALELELFERAVPLLAEDALPRTPQSGDATMHRKRELLEPEVRQIDPEARTTPAALLTRLRALTTNRWDEAAYMEVDGKRYGIHVELKAL